MSGGSGEGNDKVPIQSDGDRIYSNIDGLRYDEIKNKLTKSGYDVRQVGEYGVFAGGTHFFELQVILPYEPAIEALDGLTKKLIYSIIDGTSLTEHAIKVENNLKDKKMGAMGATGAGEELFCFRRLIHECSVRALDGNLIKKLRVENKYAIPLYSYKENTFIDLGYIFNAEERKEGTCSNRSNSGGN